MEFPVYKFTIPLPASIPKPNVIEKGYVLPADRARPDDETSGSRLQKKPKVEPEKGAPQNVMKISNLLAEDEETTETIEYSPWDFTVPPQEVFIGAETEVANMLIQLPNMKKDEKLIPSSVDTSRKSPTEVTLEHFDKSIVEIKNDEYENLKIKEAAPKFPDVGAANRLTSLNLGLPNLKYLEIESCRHLHSIGDKLLQLERLTYLRLSNLPKISNLSITNVLSTCINLQSVYLVNLNSINEITIGAQNASLKRLEVVDCRNIVGLRIANKCLQHLVVSDGRNLSQLSLSDVSNLKNLEVLRLTATPHLHLSFLEECKLTLKALELVSNAPNAKAYMLADSSFESFLKRQVNLEEIHLEKIKDVGKEVLVEALLKNKKTLKKVTLDLCCVEKVKFKEMLKVCPLLEICNVEKWYIKKKWNDW